MRTKFKNLLVQYKGGGYDGCFWEWNYFLFDASGKFHVIAASGYRGIKTESEAIALLNEGVGRHFENNHYTYRLTNKKHVHAFQAECAPSHVAGVVAKVNEILGKELMFWECDACGRKQHDADMYHSGYHGNGGTGVAYDGMLCSDCYCAGLCDNCSEYDSNEKLRVEDKRGNERYCCKYCAESLNKSA